MVCADLIKKIDSNRTGAQMRYGEDKLFSNGKEKGNKAR